MSTEKWVAGSGVGLTWTSAFTASTINSIVDGNAILSDLALDNSSALDMFCDVSFVGGSVTTTGTPFLGLYLYPLNQDGSTYGDGRFGSSAAGPPPANYLVGQLGLPVGTQAIEGMFTLPGSRSPIIIPPGQFKFVLYNKAGVTLAGSGANTIKYRTYNRQVA
jgi:hypothetical protein